MKKKMHIHFVGIKGVGMTPLAIIAKEAGFTVSGSDIDQEFITDRALRKAGIKPEKGFSEDHITTPDLVITTGAHGGFHNIEVQAAKKKNIPIMTQGEAVGVFMQGKIFGKKLKGISIAGTHGKTTTSAMVATVLKESGYDSSFVIGTGDIGSLGAPGHLGKGQYFVAEADEYATEPQSDKRAKFFWQAPLIAIITNIEFDHPDVYASVEDVRSAFLQFANQLPEKGLLIVCGDDPEIKNMMNQFKRKAVTYGFNPDNNYMITRVSFSGNLIFFWVKAYGTELGEFGVQAIGEHNALNALATVIASLEIGIPLEKIKKGLLAFHGSKRRLEFLGELPSGAKVYDDYGHHPTEIKKTLKGLRAQYPKKKIICIFQPHTYSRTKTFFTDFLRSFESVDEVIVTDIYASQREQPDPTISSKILAEAMKDYHKEIKYFPQLEDVVQYIDQKRFRSDTILVTMGAGDVYTIHSRLKLV